jgi:tRNA-splicing ligase RtcB
VLIPGSMGTASYLLVGLEGSMRETFGSCCHGAGRTMSRTKARTEIRHEDLRARLRNLGIIAEAGSSKGLVEEAPEAYKDIDAVVDVVEKAGIAKKVARFKPVAVIKG